MQFLKVFIGLFLSLAIVEGQTGRLELITQSTGHGVHKGRKGSSADSGAPEVSTDGRFVLFLSSSQNGFSSNAPISTVPNLYRMDRLTWQVELVSVGADGLPANEGIVNYQSSTNGNRVMFETKASNIVANDTNNRSDVFVRDLAQQTTLLASMASNNAAFRYDSSNASLSGDGNRVLFWNVDAQGNFLLRDLNENKTEFLMSTKVFTSSSDGSISDDGGIVVFNCTGDLEHSKNYFKPLVNLYDATSKTFVLVSDTNAVSFAPVLSADGHYVFYDTTNQIVRFNVATKEREIVVTDDGKRPRPMASSFDGSTLAFTGTGGGAVWNEANGLQSLPQLPAGAEIGDPVTGMELSRDGNSMAFTTEAKSERAGERSGQQLYFYDIAGNLLSRISPDNDGLGFIDAQTPDPALSADGSLVVFSAVSETIDANGSRDVVNLFTWTPASQVAELLTRARPNEFDSTDAGDNNHLERDVISDDGKNIVYSSTRALSAGDTNGTWDIFLRTDDSVRVLSLQANGLAGNDASYGGIISGDGNFVAFLSRATNLLDEAGPDLGLYIIDVQTGGLRLVAPEAKPVRGGPKPGYSFSRDGRYLAFTTAMSLDARDTNAFWDVYLYDTISNRTALISYSSDKASAGEGDSTFPTMSSDGKYVGFRSAARNLGPSSSITVPPPVFVRTLATGVLRRASPNGTVFGTPGTRIQFTRASAHVIFQSPGSTLSEGTSSYKAFDLATAAITTLCTNCMDATVSEDLQWSAFTRRDTTRNLFIRDLAAGTETRKTTNTFVFFPRISTNGEFVVFQCWGSLATNDSNGTADVYLYNRTAESMNLISAREGRAGNGPSLRPVVSVDQSFILFKSMATDLVANDFNGAADLFKAYLPGPDTDSDQLDDNWERAMFGSLERDGSGDFDLDGLSDRAEFVAGTEPKSAASVVSLNAMVEADGVRVSWPAAPGRSYKVQGSSSVEGGWQDLMRPLVAGNPFEEVLLSKPVGETFYFRLVSE